MKFIIENLNCSICSRRIEEKVRSLKGIDQADFDLKSKELTIDLKDEALEADLFLKIPQTILSYLPWVRVYRLDPKISATVMQIRLQGLDCPVCTGRVIHAMNELGSVEFADCHRDEKIITVKSKNGMNPDDFFNEIKKCVHYYEPEVRVQIVGGLKKKEVAELDILLEGLCCANCAAKITEAIGKMEDVEKYDFNFISKKLTVLPKAETDPQALYQKIRALVLSYEPDVSVKLIKNSPKKEVKRLTVFLDGLCCANCAAKITDAVNKMPEVEKQEFNFIQKKLTVIPKERVSREELYQKIRSLVLSFEPDVNVRLGKEEESREESRELRIRLENLCCANCAAKITDTVGKMPEVEMHSFNFIEKLLIVTPREGVLKQDLYQKIRTIVNSFEPDVNCKLEKDEVHRHEDTKLQIVVDGLHCAGCASKVETAVNKMSSVKKAEFNFIEKTLTVENNGEITLNELFDAVKKCILDMEPDVKVTRKAEESGCGHDHHELEEYTETEEPAEKKQNVLLRIVKENIIEIIGILALILGFSINSLFEGMKFNYANILVILSYLLIGHDVLLKSLRNILKGRVFDENFLMTIATIGAFILGDYFESVMVMLLYKVGETLSDYAQQRSVNSINELMKLKVAYANLVTPKGLKRVACEKVEIDDEFVVKVGEQVPVDGIVTVGTAFTDTKSVTGESAQQSVTVGDEVYAGYIVVDSPITVRATRTYENSMISKIIYLTKEASANKAQTEKFITKFARYYTPAVVLFAVGMAFIPTLLGFGAVTLWLKRAMIFLVISCPCALVLSIPLSYFAGIGAASKSGILFKGANIIEALCKAETAVFDKTGTLTKGNFAVKKTNNIDISEDEFKEYIVAAEYFSNHPLATAIKGAYNIKIDPSLIDDVTEISGKGVVLKYKGKEISVGNKLLIPGAKETKQTGTVIYLSVNGEYKGYVVLADEIKPDTKEAINTMKTLGIKKTAMLTGDTKETGENVAKEIGIDVCETELLPNEKVDRYNKLEKIGTTLYVGDGVNDAPVLALSDVGISMGALGSDAAIEAADVVLMNDSLNDVSKAIKLSKFTRKIVVQNIIFVLVIKIFFMLIGALGFANMAEAVFADVGVSLLATLNAMRIMKKKL